MGNSLPVEQMITCDSAKPPQCSRLQIALRHAFIINHMVTELVPERESGLFSFFFFGTKLQLVSLLINVRKDMFGYFKLEWNLQMLGVCVHVIHCVHHGNEDRIGHLI